MWLHPISLVLLLSSTAGLTQEPAPTLAADELALPCDWSVGSKYSVELVKSREDREGGKSTRSSESTTLIEVEIVAKDEQGYACRWTFGRTRIANADAKSDAAAEKLLNLFDGFVLDLRLDPTGSVEGFVDDEAAGKLVAASLDALKKALVGEGQSPKDVEQALGVAFGALDPAVLQRALLNEPTLFYSFCGDEYELGVPREFTDRLANPFGGDPIPTQASLELTSVRRDVSEAELEWHQVSDPELTPAIMDATFRALAKKLGRPEPTPDELPKLSFEDRGKFVFDLSTGVPKTVQWSRTTSVDRKQRIDGLRFRVTPKPAASTAK